MNGLAPFPAHTQEGTPQPELLRPIPNGVRRVSRDLTPSRPVLNGTVSSPHTNGTVTSPSSDQGESPWSSAIGPAASGGKSGRVIERLMAENDKLKRELEIANMKAQDLERSLSMVRPQMEALRQENENLSHAKSVDHSLLGRRDRKIEELKVENVAGGERVQKAEGLVRQLQREGEEIKGEFERREGGLLEQTKHATVHAEILETSHKQLAAEYRARREAWERDMAELQERREQDRHRLARLDVVYEQMRQENERTRKVQNELQSRWDELEDVMRDTAEQSTQVSGQVRKKSVEMDEVVNQMRWVMGLQKVGGLDKRKG
ncbi:mother-specific HO expression [Recurvomyces mirabilis]|nr:mother-specific HO expression [Recurvomyces mirabilis]